MRRFDDWIQAYIEYASFSEAPKRMHFFAGASAVAGALRRRVWVRPSHHYRWHTNLYVIFVARPGIVNKSTTAAIAMDILRKVPGVKFGPDVVTWPKLVSCFAEAKESFLIGDEHHIQCAITLESGEFGNLVDPNDRGMIDLLVALWDSKQGGFEKATKTSGSDQVENPWINLIACTTPAWIAGNFPDYVIGGGFTSRCLFVYADKKERLVAYPFLESPADMEAQQAALAADLEHIATTLVGEYKMSKDAIAYGESWYLDHSKKNSSLSDDAFSNYMSRKQTHIHKMAMIIEAARSDSMIIEADSLFLANKMVTELEVDMPKVFERIGRSEDSIHADRLLQYIQAKSPVPYSEAYHYVHAAFPFVRDFEGIVLGLVKSGMIKQQVMPGSSGAVLIALPSAV